MVWFFLSPPLKTGILDLLPQTERRPATRAAYRALTAEIESQAVILIEASSTPTAIRAAERMARILRKKNNSAVEKVTCAIDNAAQRRFFKQFFPARWTILSKENRALARRNDEQGLAEKAIQRLYSVVSGVPSSMIEEDPFYMFEDLAFSMPRFSGKFTLEADHLVLEDDGRVYVLLTVQGRHHSFDGDVAAKFVTTIDRAKQSVIKQFGGVRVHWTGMAKYAQRASLDAKEEVSIIGTGSFIGVVLLLILAFSSVRELLFGLLPIAVGIVAALSVTVWIFGEVHMITLVFGASLVGVCIDYSFHFFAHNLAGTMKPTEVLREVFPGITLGMITSVVGYGALLAAPFPGLQQMAVFAAVGLISAYATVVCWFPLLPFSSKSRPMPRLWRWVYTYMQRAGRRGRIVAMILVVAGLAAVPFGKANDDIRLLRGEYPSLEKEEKLITSKIGSFDKSRFLVIEASTEEALVQKEEAVAAALTREIEQNSLDAFAAASLLVPSLRVQKENKQFMQRFVTGAQARRVFDTMGWTVEDRNRVEKMIAQSRPLRFDEVSSQLAASLYSKLRLGKVDGDWVSVVLLQNVKKARSIQQAVHSVGGVTYVDKVETVTRLFTQYRRVAASLVLTAYVVIFIFLVVRYGVKRGTWIILPPLVTAVALLGAMSVLHIPMNIFTFLALLIVLAIGIDYTLFLAETTHAASTGFAIVLSGVTTILSFGLLSLSSNPGLHHFGTVVLAGMLLAMLLAPISRSADHD